jgi:hypothetical protein
LPRIFLSAARLIPFCHRGHHQGREFRRYA